MARLVFVSYRRNDCPYAAHLIYEWLAKELGDASVFIDVEDIPGGQPFPEFVKVKIAQSSAFVSVVGNNWPVARMFVPDDWVRLEHEYALEHDVPIFPVLVEGAQPTVLEQLPPPFNDIAERQALPVRTGMNLRVELNRLVEEINKVMPPDVFKTTLGLELARIDPERLDGKEHGTAKPFYLGVYPVTQALYHTIIDANPSHFTEQLTADEKQKNVDRREAGERPVDSVTFQQAVRFCSRLSDLEGSFLRYYREDETTRGGDGFRLPTVAEWEYACKAGTTSRFFFGGDVNELDDYAWHAGNSGRTTHPVGLKKKNPFGLYDLYGNVQEWCQDACESEPDNYILKGGAYSLLANEMSSTYSESAPRQAVWQRNGFRVAIDESDKFLSHYVWGRKAEKTVGIFDDLA